MKLERCIGRLDGCAYKLLLIGKLEGISKPRTNQTKFRCKKYNTKGSSKIRDKYHLL